MRREASANLFQYWNRLRGGRPAPLRTEIEPADIKGLLRDTFIVESDTRGETVFRLAGTRLCAIYGCELRGFAFSSLWRQRDGQLIGPLVLNVLKDKSVLLITYDGISRSRHSVSLELLLLPLDGGRENLRALGIVSSETQPYWLGIDPVTETSVRAMRVLDLSCEPMLQKKWPPATQPASADESLEEPLSSLNQTGRRIRHLVVLPGGRTK
jgi:hypothetical protein